MRGLQIPNHRAAAFSTASCLHVVKEATFGMGCFWEPAEELLKVDGVVDTVSGYTGNKNYIQRGKVPSYESVCYGKDWVEGVRVRYDDEQISYEELLDAFFHIQKPQIGSRQYASIIFPHDEEQTQIAESWIESNVGKKKHKDGWKVEWTAVEPLTRFFQAEGYHQRYWEKQRPRFAMIILLIAISTGLLNSIIPPEYQSTVETVANGSVVAIGLLQILERFFDSKVVEL
jgi:methionine-S-sulfoxide reductase